MTPSTWWYLNAVFITINRKTHYLWRAVDQHGHVRDILVTSRRDATAATRFFRKLLTGLEYVPRVMITDKVGWPGEFHPRSPDHLGVDIDPRHRFPAAFAELILALGSRLHTGQSCSHFINATGLLWSSCAVTASTAKGMALLLVGS